MTAKTLRPELGTYCSHAVAMLCDRSRVNLVSVILSICTERAECNRHPGAEGYGRGIVAKFASVGVDGADILIVGMEAAVPGI